MKGLNLPFGRKAGEKAQIFGALGCVAGIALRPPVLRASNAPIICHRLAETSSSRPPGLSVLPYFAYVAVPLVSRMMS
jgi:hypothetical protein